MRKCVGATALILGLVWTMSASAQTTGNPFAGAMMPTTSSSGGTSSGTMSSFFMSTMQKPNFSPMYNKPTMPQQVNVNFLSFLPKMPNLTNLMLFRGGGTTATGK